MNLEQNTERNDMKDDTSLHAGLSFVRCVPISSTMTDRHESRQQDDESR